MKKDFDLIVHKFKKSITIVPVADVHLGAIEHDRKAWDAFVRYVESNEDVYVILAGDLINNSIRTSVANPFDEVLRPREQKIRMVEYLKPIKNKILCAVSGNHERRSTKEADIDLTYDIMAKLDIEDIYRENMAFMKVSCGVRGSGTPECSYAFCVTHGAGGGIYTGATVNRNERFGNVIDGLDCLITGHTQGNGHKTVKNRYRHEKRHCIHERLLAGQRGVLVNIRRVCRSEDVTSCGILQPAEISFV